MSLRVRARSTDPTRPGGRHLYLRTADSICRWNIDTHTSEFVVKHGLRGAWTAFLCTTDGQALWFALDSGWFWWVDLRRSAPIQRRAISDSYEIRASEWNRGPNIKPDSQMWLTTFKTLNFRATLRLYDITTNTVSTFIEGDVLSIACAETGHFHNSSNGTVRVFDPLTRESTALGLVFGPTDSPIFLIDEQRWLIGVSGKTPCRVSVSPEFCALPPCDRDQ